MKKHSSYSTVLFIFLTFLLSCNQKTVNENNGDRVITKSVDGDPLPSWRKGDVKTSIISYVEDVTDPQSKNFISKTNRIAVFDNDGTLWSEQPVYFQLFYVMDKVKAMAADHPEWKTQQPYKAVLDNDMHALAQQGERALLQLLMTTHAGNTVEEFEADVKQWIKTAKHPTKHMTYDQLVYQPMLELLQYLRDHDFKTYIVSGGGTDFMRAFVSPVYGIPSGQIIGSRLKTQLVFNDGVPVIKRLPEIEFIDDKEGKPLNIQKIIGKKPVFSCGNSDGDLQMMQYTASNKLKNFMLYVHHTDSVREWAYDRNSHIGRFDKGLDKAKQKGWTIIDMAKNWDVIYPFELSGQ